MRPIYSSVLAVLVGALAAPACFSEREPPPNFRYACDVDADCQDGQTCSDGLCETPCTLENADKVCTHGEVACVNAVCSSTCDTATESCPSAQACIAPFGIPISTGSNGGGSFLSSSSSSSSDTKLGLCLRECTDTSCAAGELCIQGICVQTCTMDAECPSTFTCQGNVCLPEPTGTTGASDESTDSLPDTNPTVTITDTVSGSSSDSGDSSSSTDAASTGGTGGAT